MAKVVTLILPKLPVTSDTELKRWSEDITRYLQDFNQKSKEITFNRSERLDVADTGAVNVEFALTHHLDRIPTGYMVVKADKAGSLYTGSSTWTTQTLYLKFSAANAALTIMVF